MFKLYLKVMKALSDRTRVTIVKLLQQREMCVCELQAALKLAQPTVSKQLKVLEEAGLVESQKEGLWVNYRLTDGSDSIYARHLQAMLREWLNDDRELKKLLNRAASLNRAELTAKRGR